MCNKCKDKIAPKLWTIFLCFTVFVVCLFFVRTYQRSIGISPHQVKNVDSEFLSSWVGTMLISPTSTPPGNGLSPNPFITTTSLGKYTVTAYCPCEKCCGKWAKIPGPRVTANGHKIQEGDKFVAAPKDIPFGTWLFIEGYSDQPVLVLDRGGAIKGKKLDVFFHTHQEALNWGVKEIEVFEVQIQKGKGITNNI